MKVIMRGAVEWALGNPVLAVDEIGVEAVRVENDGSLVFEVDPETGKAVAKFKSGDGSNAWNALPYADRLLFISQDEFLEMAEEAKTLAASAKEQAESAERTASSAIETAKAAQETAGRRHASSHAAGGLDPVTPDSIGAAPADHSHGDGHAGQVLGDIRLWPFAADELPPGWYFANGDQYPLDSPQGEALNGLSDNYKTNWNIKTTDGDINLPSLFDSDGRGLFLRAVDGTTRQVGDVQQDTFKSHAHTYITPASSTTLTNGSYVAIYPLVGTTNAETNGAGEEETRPLNGGMAPAVYLGV